MFGLGFKFSAFLIEALFLLCMIGWKGNLKNFQKKNSLKTLLSVLYVMLCGQYGNKEILQYLKALNLTLLPLLSELISCIVSISPSGEITLGEMRTKICQP